MSISLRKHKRRAAAGMTRRIARVRARQPFPAGHEFRVVLRWLTGPHAGVFGLSPPRSLWAHDRGISIHPLTYFRDAGINYRRARP